MPRIISLINLKGGVAKTTTTVQLADCLSNAGKRVLVIDLDPQANATESLVGRNKTLQITKDEVDGGSADNRNISQCFFDLLEETKYFDIHQVRLCDTSNLKNERGEKIQGLDLIPSSLKLLDIQDRLYEVAEKTGYMISPVEVLKFYLKPILQDYNFVLIDCPPSLNLLTRNALEISHFYLVPVINDPLSTRGLYQILKKINTYAEVRHWAIKCLGVIITKYRRGTSFQQERSQLVSQITSRCRELRIQTPIVFKAYMPESEGVSRAMDYDQIENSGITFKAKYRLELGDPKQALYKWVTSIANEMIASINSHYEK